MENATYDVFLSYSHADGKFAARLERALARYTPPRGVTAKRKRLRVYRDVSEASGPRLTDELTERLRGSGKLVVICSPAARASKWVATEIQTFTGGAPSNRVIPVLAAGSPDTHSPDAAFPDALTAALQDEPWAPDFRRERERDLPVRGNRPAWYHLLASIYDVKREEIEQRERRRSRISLSAAAVVGAAVLGTGIYFVGQRQVRESLELATRATQLARTDTAGGIRTAAAAVTASPTPQALAALRSLVGQKLSNAPYSHEESVMSASADSSTFAVASPYNTARLFDVRSGAATPLCAPEKIKLLTHSDDGKYVVGIAEREGIDSGNGVYVWDTRDGRLVGFETTKIGDTFAHLTFLPDGSAFLIDSIGDCELRRLPSGKLIAPIGLTLGEQHVAFSPDGNEPGSDDALAIRSAATGQALWRYSGAAANGFDFAAYANHGNRIVAYGEIPEETRWRFLVLDLGANGLPVSAKEVDELQFDFSLLFDGTRRKVDPIALREPLGRQMRAKHPEVADKYGFFSSVYLSPDGSVAIATANKFPPVLFSPADMSSYVTLADLQGQIRNLQLTDGALMAVQGYEWFGVWSVKDHRKLWRVDLKSSALQFSTDGSRIIVQFYDTNGGKVGLAAYEAATGRLISELPAPDGAHIVVMSTDAAGKRVVARAMHAAYVWDVDSGRIVREENLYRFDAAQHKIDVETVSKSGSADDLLRIAKHAVTDCRAAALQ